MRSRTTTQYGKTTFFRLTVVYLVLLPIMAILTEAVWGGLFGALAGVEMVKTLKDPENVESIMTILEEKGFPEIPEIEDAAGDRSQQAAAPHEYVDVVKRDSLLFHYRQHGLLPEVGLAKNGIEPVNVFSWMTQFRLEQGLTSAVDGQLRAG